MTRSPRPEPSPPRRGYVLDEAAQRRAQELADAAGPLPPEVLERVAAILRAATRPDGRRPRR